MRGLLPLDATRGASAPEATRHTAFSILLAVALCLSFAAESRAQPDALPAAPTVTAGDAALAVEWQVPPDGGPAINGYHLRYSKDGRNWTHVSNLLDPYATLTGLDNGQPYQVQVRAVNADGGGPWSASGTGTPAAVTPPGIQVETVVSDLFLPWDLAFTPDGAMLFTERNFTLSVRLADGTVRKLQHPRDFTDKLDAFEIGLMAIVVDPDFAGNRRFYTCQSHWDTNRATAEIQVIAWNVNAGYTRVTRVKDPLVGGIPIRAGGRHGGCRLRFGPENYLWIATGDAAMPTVPQDLDSLGGKVLRVDGTTGAGAPDNPFGSGGAKTLIYTYGHRNPQGLALRPGTSQMWSVEHGPHRHDEVNLLVKGDNYGFDPVDPDRPSFYAERSAPMTDRSKFPDAVPAKWSSGRYGTLAASGGIFLEGEQWGAWNGWLAVAALRETQLRLLRFTPGGTLINETIVPELHGRFGRLRTPMMGPDGALYVTTSNAISFAGSPAYADRILRVFVHTPGSAPGAPPELSATVGDGSITLTWSAPGDGGSRIIRYEYRYAVSGGPYGEWATVPGGAGETSVTIDDLTNGTEYRFEVRAVNGAGNGEASGVEATPLARIDFPHFANGRQSDGTAITSDIVLVNVETRTVHPAISFYDQQGERMNAETVVEMTEDLEVVENGVLTAARGIEGKSEITISTHGEGPLVTGSVRVTATGRMGGVLRFDLPGTGVAGVGAGEAVREAIFPARRMADGINTGAAIRNLSAESMTVTCHLMQRGEVMGTAEIGLAGDGQSARFLHELFPEADTSHFVGSVLCAAEEGGMFTAVALELDAGNGVFTTLPVAPVDAAAAGGGRSTLNFAHFANGEFDGVAMSSDLVFVNVANTAVAPAVHFYDQDGNRIAAGSVVDLTAGGLEVTGEGALTATEEIPILGEMTVSTHGMGDGVAGSVRVVSDGPLGAVLRFDIPTIGVAGVGASEAVNAAIFMARRTADGINTGAALRNLGSEATTVTCRLMADGRRLDEAVIPLAGRGQSSRFINEIFTAADTEDFEGSVHCAAPDGSTFTGVALEMDFNNRIFTTLPMVPVP